MKVRYGVAAAFAAAIALVLILRNEGYLHGRVEGGPLTLGGSGGGATIKPKQTAAFGLELILEGGPVDIQSVRGEFVSPGLQLLGPRRAADPCRACVYRRWPPPNTTPLRGATISDEVTPALLGARATQPGIYYVRNLVALYKRGLKSYRRTDGRDYCVVVTRHRRRLKCPFEYSPPSDAIIAEAGGPSRYDTRVEADASGERGQATYAARPGRDTIAITLTNLTDIAREVSGLEQVLEFEGADIAVRQVRPEHPVIQPHDGRRVRFEIVIEGCARPGAEEATVEDLRGQVGNDEDVVPLSVGIGFRAPRSCSEA